MLTTVRQATSQVGASRNRGYEDGELVFILNKMQDRYIDRQLEFGDDGTAVVRHPGKIRPLLVSDRSVRTYKGTDAVYAILPGDLLHITGKAAQFSCPAAFKDTPPATFHEIAVEQSKKSAAPFYKIEVLMAGTKKLEIPAQVQYNDTLIKSTMTDQVFHYLLEKGYEVYRQLGNKQPSQALPSAHADILVVRDPGNGLVQLQVDGTVQRSAAVTFNGIEAAGSTQMIPMDLVSHLLVHDYIKTPYFRPTYGKALATLNGRELKVFGPDNGIVVGVYLSYVRKPRPMDVILSRDCELSSDSCEEICDLAVEYITKGTTPELYQVTRADNEKRP